MENSSSSHKSPKVTGGLVRIRATCTGLSALLQNRLSPETLEAIRTKAKAGKNAPRGTPREECGPKLHTTAEGAPAMPLVNVVASLTEAGRSVRLDGKKQMSTATSTVLFSFVIFGGSEMLPLTMRDGVTPSVWEADVRKGTNPNGGEAVAICRPRFDEWQFTMDFDVDTAEIGVDKIRELFDIAGSRVGLCDFRPACKGWFGRFSVTKWEEVSE